MSINKGNVFSSKNLCGYMLSSLPKEASPQLRDPYDAVALLSHACMLTVGFRLQGLGEDHRIGWAHHQLSHTYLQITNGILPEASSDPEDPSPLPQEWNATASSNYAFRYAHNQSSLQYILKVTRLGSKAIINGLGIGDDKVHTLEIAIKDFLSPSSFPFTISSTDNDSPQSNEDTLAACFISVGRIADLASMIKFQIIQKLAPGLQKEGYEESAHAANTSDNTSSSRRPPPQEQQSPERGDPAYDPLRDDRLPPLAQPRPFNDPLAAEPRRPYPAGDFPPPGFEDEYEMNRPPAGGFGAGRRTLNIGERDLYPPGLGPHDPLRGPGFGPGGGGMGGGGMHPTFDDPLFRGDGPGGGSGPYAGR